MAGAAIVVAGSLALGVPGADAATAAPAAARQVAQAISSDPAALGYSRPVCEYPVSRKPQLVVSVPARTRPNRIGVISGHVLLNGCGLGRAKIAIYRSSNGKSGWVRIGYGTTNPYGDYRFNVKSRKTIYLRVVVASGSDYSSVTSSVRRFRVW
jgi:hypothetical protein